MRYSHSPLDSENEVQEFDHHLEGNSGLGLVHESSLMPWKDSKEENIVDKEFLLGDALKVFF